jgi:2-polyprenyl-6-methoxyphenol hydroxylase-like FAD-dependent oxidoreductase
VVGAGIGGLCAAVGLRRRGWEVTVLERAPRFAEVGAGLTLMANGLRGLGALGLGAAVEAAGRVEAPGGIRTPTGRWIARVDGAAMTRLLGTSAVGIHRAALHGILREALPAAAVLTGAEVVEVAADPPTRVDYRQDGQVGSIVPDLVVAADGIGSVTRSRLWPDLPPPVYSGSTAWRAVTERPWRGELVTAITWGSGTEFGMVPLGDGRVYWYAAVNAEPGQRFPGRDELSAIQARFGDWHAPIPTLIAATDRAAVIRTDLRHIAVPPPAYNAGAVALLGDAAHAMVPNLGQGANQAIEDAVVLAACCDPAGDPVAALVEYDRERRPRAQAVARAALRTAQFGQRLRNPLGVGLRNTAMRLTPPRMALRSIARYAEWTPPSI